MLVAAVAGALITIGALLMLLAGVGVLRFPDALTRASAATKATGLGVATILVGVAVAIGTPSAAAKITVAIVLQFATAPLAGHVIGRAAYRSGAALWEGTVVDDYRRFFPYEEQRRAREGRDAE